jgi:hypothetical protein
MKLELDFDDELVDEIVAKSLLRAVETNYLAYLDLKEKLNTRGLVQHELDDLLECYELAITLSEAFKHYTTKDKWKYLKQYELKEKE